MMAGVNLWAELMTAGIGMIETWVKTQEMLVAANSVIGKRTAVITYAARNPVAGDYTEFGRMVPEKVSAFLEAGRVLTSEWATSLLETSHHAYHVWSFMLRGRTPSAVELLVLGAPTARAIIVRTEPYRAVDRSPYLPKGRPERSA